MSESIDFTDRANRLTKYVAEIPGDHGAATLVAGFALVLGATDEEFERYLDDSVEIPDEEFSIWWNELLERTGLLEFKEIG